MVVIEENVNLKPYNSFGVAGHARYFCHVRSVSELVELIQSDFYKKTSRFVLGEGTNILLTKDFEGLVIKVELKGIETVSDREDTVEIKAGAGERWHDLVMYCVDHGWGGIENLSLIPGTVGAAPIQNIGAYGVEIAEVVKEVEGVDSNTGVLRTFTREQCGFEYRESAFKTRWKEKIFISSVTLTLTKKNHALNVNYGAIQDTLKQLGEGHVNVKSISDAVIHIRRSKLPDHARIGNAGSFFKNPTLRLEHYQHIRSNYPTAPSYPIDNQNVKVPAAWLIEQCGWKGKRINDVGVHPQQALVLVNYGTGSGAEILQLSKQIQSDVKEKFDVHLTPEVNII